MWAEYPDEPHTKAELRQRIGSPPDSQHPTD
jgi:hypothetical protein